MKPKIIPQSTDITKRRKISTENKFQTYRRETSNFIAQSLRLNNGNLFCGPLVGIKIQRQTVVVFFDDDPRGLLHSLSTNATCTYITTGVSSRQFIVQCITSGPQPQASRRRRDKKIKTVRIEVLSPSFRFSPQYNPIPILSQRQMIYKCIIYHREANFKRNSTRDEKERRSMAPQARCRSLVFNITACIHTGSLLFHHSVTCNHIPTCTLEHAVVFPLPYCHPSPSPGAVAKTSVTIFRVFFLSPFSIVSSYHMDNLPIFKDLQQAMYTNRIIQICFDVQEREWITQKNGRTSALFFLI